MYYSHSLQDEKFDFFASFLRESISGNNSYKPQIDTIIRDAHRYANGIIDIYSVDRSGFPIIVYLVKVAKDYFNNINIDNLTEENYKHILSLITKQRDVHSV